MGYRSPAIRLYAALALALAAGPVLGQTLPSTFPHNYPGIPNTSGDFSNTRAWQRYYQVKEPLPNITFPLTESFAGNLPVNREGHANNTLFFWAFSTSNGSLTDSKNSDKPWVIWLNGGPGSSSLLGLLLENGPIHFNEDFTAFSNKYSWSNVADTFWIDQPVGTGFSTSDAKGYIADETQMADDFFGFLSNLVQVFPSLAKRPLYLTGESYAGVYIPYLTKKYFSLSKPPVSMRKIAIGDGLMALEGPSIHAVMLSMIETYPQLIGYDTSVLTYFREQTHLCGFDVNLTYPQNGIIPTIPVIRGGIVGSGGGGRSVRDMLRTLGSQAKAAAKAFAKRGHAPRHNEEARRAWKRDLAGRANGTIDPWYGCDLLFEVLDYALNFSAPWKGNSPAGFDVYDIPDALDPEAAPGTDSIGSFLNDPGVVSAIHAPTSKKWISSFTPQTGYPFGSSTENVDPSPPPMEFFSELASNISARGMSWILYSGNADLLIPHLGTEIVIQNTSFGGIQGFTQKPATPWFDDEGNFAGKIHQERNLTYVLFDKAGHLVPQSKPIAALTFLREFVLGNNPLGSVLANGTVVGGTNASMAEVVLPAKDDGIFFGSGTTSGTFFYPTATVAAWDKFTGAAAAASATSAARARPAAAASAWAAAALLATLVLQRPAALFAGLV